MRQKLFLLVIFAVAFTVCSQKFSVAAEKAVEKAKDDRVVKDGATVSFDYTLKGADGKLMTVKRAVTAARWTFIIGKDGNIAYKNTKVDPVKDSKQVADILEELEKK